MRTVVIGLGNPILGDDGIGWKVVERINTRGTSRPDIASDCLSVGGLALMEHLIGYERAIIIDAVQTGQNPIGAVRRYQLEEMFPSHGGHTTSAHDTDLSSAVQVGRCLGAKLPEEIIIVGIEARPVYEFTQELSPRMAEAIPLAAQLVLQILEEKQ